MFVLCRVAWYPVGLYHDQKRTERSRRLCYTVITVCLMAGTVALVVSWLLATGIIDPDRRAVYKEARKLDYFSETNAVNSYPKVVKSKNDSKDEIEVALTAINVQQADVESVTGAEGVADINNEDEESLEVTTIVTEMEMEMEISDYQDTMELNDEAEVVNILDESFQISAETEDDQESTDLPEEIEMTTVPY